MKSLKVMAALLVAAAMTSCSAVNPLAATSNTVGTKCGQASYPVFLSVLTFGGDASINKAAKEAGIKKITLTLRQQASLVFTVQRQLTFTVSNH